MLTGININEVKPYISKLDIQEPKSKFMIGVLDPAVKAYVEDQTTVYDRDENGNPKARIMFSQRAYLTVKFGLRGVENFLDPSTGKPAEFKTEQVFLNNRGYAAVSDEIMRLLGDGNLLSELAMVIWEWNGLSEEETKN